MTCANVSFDFETEFLAATTLTSREENRCFMALSRGKCLGEVLQATNDESVLKLRPKIYAAVAGRGRPRALVSLCKYILV